MNKLCVDCTHYKKIGGIHFCLRKEEVTGHDPITGRQKKAGAEFAFVERDSNLNPWRCGKKGRFFTLKEQP